MATLPGQKKKEGAPAGEVAAEKVAANPSAAPKVETGGEENAAPRASDVERQPKPVISDYIAGESKDFVGNLSPYLPQDLIGGSVPYIAGTEDEAVWNAASQACSTEKVHYCYTVEGGRCWYLACPSAVMASNPDSWCPLAAALPGNSDFWDKETVYLYEQEGMALALRWDPETGRMQVFLGAARTLLPRIQSMDANFVTVNAETAKIVPWKNRQLRTEKLSRATANTLLYSGLIVSVLLFIFITVEYFMTMFVSRDLATVKASTDRASTNLMMKAYNALQSDTIKHMVRIQELLDALEAVDGTLLKYEVNRGKVQWDALVPRSFAECKGALSPCTKSDKLEKDGRVRISGTK